MITQQRTLKLSDVKLRTAENGNPVIEGYFAKYNQPYFVCSGWIEIIAPGAFDQVLRSGADVKVIWNHNADIVLGSTAAGTAELRSDDIGLWGRVEINPKDTEAMNCYERIKRGDVDGCSFGFDIKSFEEVYEDDGTYRTTITEVNPLYEVSPCTFPAYESTEIHARNKASYESAVKRFKQNSFDSWKQRVFAKLKSNAKEE